MKIGDEGNQMLKRNLSLDEDYVDDMMEKMRQPINYVLNLEEFFEVFKSHKTRLNPKICVFGVFSRNSLNYLVFSRGIKADPKKSKL